MSQPQPVIIGPDLVAMMARWRQQAKTWATGRLWWARAPLLAYLLLAGYWRLGDREATSWFDGITLLIHELGHVLFAPFGEFLTVAGGSITQLLAPLAAIVILRRQGDWFGMTVGGGWLAMSLYQLAVYVADAQEQALPLVGFVPDPEHDWHRLLSDMGMLAWDERLARMLEGGAFCIWLGSCLLGAWLIWQMFRTRSEEPTMP